ncbi:hypothetical protein GCM10029992_11480 [Glycomyces albus]
MQAVAMLRAGWEPAGEADLAIAAASHKGEPFHLERVDSVLSHAGLGEDSLQCPPDLPGDPAARRAVVARGGEARRVYMNCSGKHAGMLAACAAAGWDTESYRDPGHPPGADRGDRRGADRRVGARDRRRRLRRPVLAIS